MSNEQAKSISNFISEFQLFDKFNGYSESRLFSLSKKGNFSPVHPFIPTPMSQVKDLTRGYTVIDIQDTYLYTTDLVRCKCRSKQRIYINLLPCGGDF